jgi:ribosome-binding protein aMBF1 (putative translation factor)
VVDGRRPPPVPLSAGLIRQARERRGWSREKLAAELGCSLKTVERYEAGRRVPTRETAARIILALEIGPAELLGAGAAGTVGPA